MVRAKNKKKKPGNKVFAEGYLVIKQLSSAISKSRAKSKNFRRYCKMYLF